MGEKVSAFLGDNSRHVYNELFCLCPGDQLSVYLTVPYTARLLNSARFLRALVKTVLAVDITFLLFLSCMYDKANISQIVNSYLVLHFNDVLVCMHVSACVCTHGVHPFVDAPCLIDWFYLHPLFTVVSTVQINPPQENTHRFISFDLLHPVKSESLKIINYPFD